MLRPLLIIAFLAPVAIAQPTEVPDAAGESPASGVERVQRLTLDQATLLALYDLDQPVATSLLRAAEYSSTRVFITAVPIAAAMTYASTGGDMSALGPVYRAGVAQAGTTAIVYLFKFSAPRLRPYAVESGVYSRSPVHPRSRSSDSFPSGHAAIAFTLATSASLAVPEWYVVAPALGWATLVSVARPWLGVHYPSDVLAGAALGAGVAVVVHLAGDAITPSALRAPQDEAQVIMLPIVRVGF